MTEQDFKEISEGNHVFSIETNVRLPNLTDTTFLTSQLCESLAKQAGELVIPQNAAGDVWRRFGVPAKLLILGSDRWLKGKVRIKFSVSVEFAPDPNQD